MGAIHRRRWQRLALAICLGMTTAISSSFAQDTTSPAEEAAAEVPHEIVAGRVPANDLNENFQFLLNRIIELEDKVAGTETTIKTLTQQEIDDINEVKTDGLVIAHFTALPGPDSFGMRLVGMVNEDVDEPSIKPNTERIADSFITVPQSHDRSATIVMPVYAGETYEIIFEFDEGHSYDEEKHLRGAYFVRF